MTNFEEFEDFVYMQALENAVSFKGAANPKALIGKCMPKFHEMKKNMGEYVPRLNAVVEQVNSLGLDVQTKKLLELKPDFFEEKKEKKVPNKTDGLPKLEDLEKGVVVRFPPAPSGHLHLGHLFGIVANYELKRKYGGKFILRFEDTNPDNIDLKNYEKVVEDVNWITNNGVDEVFYQSDRMEIYHKYVRTLFELGECYVCQCDSETFKAFTDAKEECPHRRMGDNDKKELFDTFMSGKMEGVLRAKADLDNKNPALRTFPLARINANAHARAGTTYKVWPNYNLACAIDDSLMNLTHVLRGKDLEIGEDRQKMIHKALGLKSPHYFHYGRMKFEDVELSKSELTKLIESGKYSGWDDPRVPSILAYKKRGYKAEAFRNLILALGISKRDSRITSAEYHKQLDFFNKQILEKEATRYFFVHNPKKVHIKNVHEITDKEIISPKHPEDKSFGNRVFDVQQDYLIDSIDFKSFEVGDLFRLMHFANFKILSKTEDTIEVEFVSKEYSKELGTKRNIHFLQSGNTEPAVVVLQDNSHIKGLTEKLGNPKVGDAIQFERFGFVRFDHEGKDDVREFRYTHN
jgi:glutamyl-tRNA synthetase